MKTLKKITAIFSWLVALVVFVSSGILVLSKFNTPVKIRVFSVLSGSMEPAIPVSSVIIVKPEADYQVGDVVTVRAESPANGTVTHRINSVITDKETKKVSYLLKGDANEEPDAEAVSRSRVIGKVIFHVPLVGKVVAFAQSQMGFLLLVVIPSTILIYTEMVTIKNEILDKVKKWKAKKEKSKIKKKVDEK